MPQHPSPTPSTNESPESVGRAAGARTPQLAPGVPKLPALSRRASSDVEMILAEWICSVKSSAVGQYAQVIICVLCQLIHEWRAAVGGPASCPISGPSDARYRGNRWHRYPGVPSKSIRSPRARRSSGRWKTTTPWRCDRGAALAGIARPHATGSDRRTVRTAIPRRGPAQALASRRAARAPWLRAPSGAPPRWARATTPNGRPAPAWSAPAEPASCAAQVAIACSSLPAKLASSADRRTVASFCAVRS
jgi:hypothetical protein